MKQTKYGLKIKTPQGNVVWYNMWTEAIDDVMKPYLFNTQSAAEEFRDNYELTNFTVVEYDE